MAKKNKKEKPTTGKPQPKAPEPVIPAEPEPPDTPRKGAPVVGIGASAGGLEAFKKFFSAMPPRNGMAFVLIPHLDPTHESLMVELLRKYTSMPVSEAGEGVAVEPDHVYIIPPNKYLTISGGVLRLTGPVERGRSQTSIDFFLRSLAEDQREKAICIILSGTGAHGTLGLKAVKAEGGMAMVQDPNTAEYPRMPESAIESGLADYVLPVAEMPAALLRYVEHFYVNGSPVEITEESDQLNRILVLLRTRSKYDFRGYRKKMLLRRIERRMGLNHIRELPEYLEQLRHQPGELKLLAKDMLISVTSFFRDPEAFRALQTLTVAPLVEAKEPDQALRIWVPACATGEEAYSIGMLFVDQLAQVHKNCRLQIFATDTDEEAMSAARHAIYPESIAGDLTPDRLARFFSKEDDRYLVNKELRENVVFAVHNLISDAPFSKVDLISCRNLLIYLEPDVQRKIVALLHFALKEGGYLLLGPSETIGRQVDLFDTVSKKWRIYRRIGAARPERVDFPIVPRGAARPPAGAAEAAPTRHINFADVTRDLLLGTYAPAAVLVSRKNEVLYFFGPTMRYLDQPTGAPTQDLILLAREGLRTKLRVALQTAQSAHEKVVSPGIRVKRDGSYRTVRLTVQPVHGPGAAEGLFLITFEEEQDASQTASVRPEAGGDDSVVHHLENELKTTREDLQTTIEDLESSNEELKAANEEVMSMNEELQSANEELETSKEELQSLNEELSTVNNQLQDKVEELETAGNDMANLLNSTDVATIFLDRELCIKRYTPATSHFLNLLPGDLGRPLRDIAPRFADPGLQRDAEHVLRHLAVMEKELRTEDNRWCIRRIIPYRTQDNKIEGVVVTLLDISAIKHSEEELRRMSKVFMDGADPIIIEDLHGRIVDFNLETEAVYGWRRADLLGQPAAVLLAEDNHEQTETLRARCRQGHAIRNAQRLHRTRAGQVFPVLVTLSLLRDEKGQPTGIAQITKSITELKRAEVELKQAAESLEKRVAQRTTELQTINKQLQAEIAERTLAEEALTESQQRIAAIVDNAADAFVSINESGTIESFNKAAEQMFGCAAAAMIGHKVSSLLADGEDISLEACVRTGPREMQGRRHDGTSFPCLLGVSEIRHDKQRYYTAAIHDLTEWRRLERQALDIVEQEQRRIGVDLHDVVGQELTGLSLLSENLLDYFKDSAAAEAKNINTIADGLKRALHTVRELSHGLIPVQVEPEGLMGALKELARRTGALHKISCTFECRRPVLVNEHHVATHLYRIAQEAITNAIKHSKTKNIRMRLENDHDRVQLSIADDGVGFSQTREGTSGMGLRILQYRAGLINANLTVKSEENTGTVVTCTFPLEKRIRGEK